MPEVKREREPGMDDSQAQADRQGWQTTVEMVTGKGMKLAANDGGGMEVGNGFDNDPMGEESSAVTYPPTEPGWGSYANMAPNASMPVTTRMGSTVASAPQTRTETKKDND